MKRATALILMLCLLLTACGSGKNDAWQEQYDLGMKHLGFGNYTEAIEAFSAAIDIDPDRKEAYTQRAEAYLRLARQLSQNLAQGNTEVPEVPRRTEPVRGQSNPQQYTETTEPWDQNDPVETVPLASYDPEDFYTHPGSETSPTESGSNDQDRNIRDLIEDLLDWANKDREIVVDIDPDEKKNQDPIPSYEDLVPPEPAADSIAALLDYGFLINALEEMGCSDVCWEVSDLDGDGSPELLVETIASASGIPSQLTADTDTQALFAFTPTGAAQSSSFCRFGDDGYCFYTGYHTVGNQEEIYYAWNGQTWLPAEIEPYEWFSLLFGPDLWSATSEDTVAATAAALENLYLNRPGYVGSLSEDLNGDGSREYILLLRGAANHFFQNLQAANAWYDEPYLVNSDLRISAVVVSEQSGRTLVRSARLDTAPCENVYIEDGCLYIDGMYYAYQDQGVPLTESSGQYGEIVLADNILDLSYFLLAIPDSWEGRYAYDILENPYLDGIPERYWVTFYERQEYEASGCGVLFEIVMVMEGTDFDHPDADLMGIYYYGDPANPNCLMYSVYVCYPTDVQFTEENAEAYFSLLEDVDIVIRSFEADPYCYFHSYYTDTH